MGLFSAYKAISDNVGKVVTISGLLLFPFFGAAAGGMLAAKGAAATTGQVLTSFWSSLATNHLTGEIGLGAGLTNMFNGFVGLGQSAFHVASAAWDPNLTFSAAWNAPLLAQAAAPAVEAAAQTGMILDPGLTSFPGTALDAANSASFAAPELTMAA